MLIKLEKNIFCYNLSKLRNKKNKKNYSLWVDEYREYMLTLKNLVKPIKSGEDPMVMHDRAIEYTLRKIKEWTLSDRSAARNTNP